jgi:ornithine cyclodeaminase/alanine dehydrogenase-like protein (mu-crystallin family)
VAWSPSWTRPWGDPRMKINNSPSAVTPNDVIVLSDESISRAISLKEVISLVEAGFAANASGHAFALPAVVESLDCFRLQFGIKSGYLHCGRSDTSKAASYNYLSNAVGDVLGLKAGGYWQANPATGLPGHRAVVLLLDPHNGSAAALMSANAITRLRTAAAGAVAAKYLARQESHVAGIIGAGDQAHAQLEALLTCRKISQVYVWARRMEQANAYAEIWNSPMLQVKAVKDIRAVLEKVDVLITTTPSTEALVESRAVKAGTHITALGSDGKGKRELDPKLLSRSKIVVDNRRQSFEIGELQHLPAERIDQESTIHAELGEICAGMKPGRENPLEITVFDSSGVSCQDLVVAGHLLRRAKSEGFGERIRL